MNEPNLICTILAWVVILPLAVYYGLIKPQKSVNEAIKSEIALRFYLKGNTNE